MTDDDLYRTWEADAALLAEVGQVLFRQETRVTVQLPGPLAELVVAAWERDDDDGYEPLADETVEQARSRHRAGVLALIGLSIQERSETREDHVVFDLDAWYIGSAYDAAEDAGLRLEPPDRQP